MQIENDVDEIALRKMSSELIEMQSVVESHKSRAYKRQERAAPRKR